MNGDARRVVFWPAGVEEFEVLSLDRDVLSGCGWYKQRQGC